MDLGELLNSLQGGGVTIPAAVVAVVAALLAMLLRRGKRGRGSSASQRRAVAAKAQLKEFSPGRDGEGATRDLEASELARIEPRYAPSRDGLPTPGEVIWTWVPYVENDGRGKDRPVLILATIGLGVFAGCYLTSKPHRGFVSVGSGTWDSQGRESFLNPERVLRITSLGMRREAGGLRKDQFETAARAVLAHHGIRG